MRLFEVTDDGVLKGLPITRPKRRGHVTRLGDHGIIRISKTLGQSAVDGRILNGYPLLIGNNTAVIYDGRQIATKDRVLINSYDDQESRKTAIVLLRLTALPGRKSVTYDVPPEQLLTSAKASRQLGRSTYRWKELLVLMNPGQTVVAHIECIVPEWKIAPLLVTYDGEAVDCNQEVAAEAVANREECAS